MYSFKKNPQIPTRNHHRRNDRKAEWKTDLRQLSAELVAASSSDEEVPVV